MFRFNKTFILTLSIVLFSLHSYSCQCGSYEYKTIQDLEEYKFIALIQIDSIYKAESKPSKGGFFYNASFSIIELYRGNKTNTLKISGGSHSLGIGMTSCDMGLERGEEWVIFAYENKHGELQTGYCTYSRMYKSVNGERDWHYRRGFSDITKIKNILGIESVQAEKLEGLIVENYTNDSIESESYYVNGKLEGIRKIYYSNGKIMSLENYKDGLLFGNTRWYYKSGQLKREYNFENNKPINGCFGYFLNGRIRFRQYFDLDSNSYIRFNYSYEGKLVNCEEKKSQENEYKKTVFFDSGEMHYISISNLESFDNKITTQYYKNGQVEGVWKKFSIGLLKLETKRWDKKGLLMYHSQKTHDGSEIVILDKTKKGK